ncbi:uncharacterized protein HMPREF1541_05162 [Cyphellophora europaea CBS 101466]|uniref:DUF1479 domain protein n=1 Tax=Cyphellophora europaea (strain CBS 101466) TaxID=1220924 RepID=W2RWU4_CYPE1|nr:uncharacterized protein HMPREF1541_05162 [Cyphellophora europaea CBS 101466]ETN40882.1 hypothetical protein HMPREF1541_05162 [Cyphellophora europaea CBS 101466]
MQQAAVQSLRRAASTLTKEAGDISSVFPSLSGKTPDPLPPRFSDLKKSRIAGNEDAVKASWHRLLSSLRQEIDEIKAKGNSVIPSIDYEKVRTGQVSPQDLEAIRHRGLAVIRNVVPRQEALDLKAQAQEYIDANQPKVRAFPADDPAVYELYWTPTQVQARGHPNMLQTQSFMNSLWHSSNRASQISTTYPLTYADRFRIRRPGDAKFALGPHTDGGSVERWEDPEYSRVYTEILRGNWEAYDPFDAHHRITATMDMYNGGGACSMFRLFQGWLSMSSTGPGEGTLKVCPFLKHATSYLILRPFFNLDTNELNLDNSFPNSNLGAAQEYDPVTHPHLELETTMINVPHVEPGDYVAWHCDTIHAVDKQHRGTSDSSVLYIPACAITARNIDSLKQQRDAAMKYSPPPDFPGAGGEGEQGFHGATNWDAVASEAQRAMGYGSSKWAVTSGMSEGEQAVIERANRTLFA